MALNKTKSNKKDKQPSRSINPAVIKRLFAETNGICSKCSKSIIGENTTLGEVCHIEAHSEGGPRYNSNLSEEEIRNYENLIVLCGGCHKEIDTAENIEKYSVQVLQAFKKKFNDQSKKQLKQLTTEELAEIEKVFFNNIETELFDIKALLCQLNAGYTLENIEDVFKNQYTYTQPITEIKNFLFNDEELSFIDSTQKSLKKGRVYSTLISGQPSCGKTTLVLKLVENLINDFQVIKYLDLNTVNLIADIKKDLISIKNFPSIVIIDNAHIDYSKACEIYKECQSLLNINLIFITRLINDTLKTDGNSGVNLFERSDILFELNPFKNRNEKINKLISNQQDKIFKENNIVAEVGDLNKVYYLINGSLLKLNILLKIWESTPEVKLDEIDSNKLNEKIHQRYFNGFSPNEKIYILKYTCINQFEIAFYFQDSDIELEQKLSEKGLIIKSKDGGYSFFHSSFSRLLLNALIQEDSNFKINYPKGYLDFELKMFKNYFLFFNDDNRSGYSPFLGKTLNKLIVNRGYKLFNSLTSDTLIKEQIIQYFEAVDITDEFYVFLSNIRKYNPNEILFYQENLVLKNNKLKSHLKFEVLDALSLRKFLSVHSSRDIDGYKSLLKLVSEKDLKRILYNSELNEITYCLRSISDFDKKLALKLIDYFTKEQWINIFQKASFLSISNSIIELSQLKGRKFASEVLEKIEINPKSIQVEKIPLANLTKTISELKRFGNEIPKQLISELDTDFFESVVIKSPLSKLSKSLKELYPFNENIIKSVVNKMSDDFIISNLEAYNLEITGRILSELYDISNDKISSLTSNQKFVDLIKQKIINETKCGYLAIFISNLNKINKQFADRLVKAIPLKIFNNVLNEFRLIEFASLINEISKLPSNYDKSVTIFNSISNKIIIKKIIIRDFEITAFQSVFDVFSKIDSPKTTQVLDNIDTQIIAEKSMKFGVNARKISQTLKSLFPYNNDKIISVLHQFLHTPAFIKKIDLLNPTDFTHTYANLITIDYLETYNCLNSKLNSFKIEDFKTVDISGFSDGLRRLNSLSKLDVNDSIITIFEEYLIRNVQHFKISQISTCFINLKSINSDYAKHLLNNVPIVIVINKFEWINSKDNLSSSLGELKKVSIDYWKKLVEVIDYK